MHKNEFEAFLTILWSPYDRETLLKLSSQQENLFASLQSGKKNFLFFFVVEGNLIKLLPMFIIINICLFFLNRNFKQIGRAHVFKNINYILFLIYIKPE